MSDPFDMQTQVRPCYLSNKDWFRLSISFALRQVRLGYLLL